MSPLMGENNPRAIMRERLTAELQQEMEMEALRCRRKHEADQAERRALNASLRPKPVAPPAPAPQPAPQTTRTPQAVTTQSLERQARYFRAFHAADSNYERQECAIAFGIARGYIASNNASFGDNDAVTKKVFDELRSSDELLLAFDRDGSIARKHAASQAVAAKEARSERRQ
jgi:hypothetical protein